jgi:hypothetical protein
MEEARDIAIIIVSVLGTLFFTILITTMGMTFLTLRGLVRDVRDVVDEEVKPTLHAVRDGVNSARAAGATVAGVGVTAAGGNAAKAVTMAVAGRRILGMIRNRGK